jgi:hypothetical protein
VKRYGENHTSLICTLHPILSWVFKLRGLRWEEHVARMGGRGGYRGFSWGNLKERERLEDQGIDGNNIKMDLQVV